MSRCPCAVDGCPRPATEPRKHLGEKSHDKRCGHSGNHNRRRSSWMRGRTSVRHAARRRSCMEAIASLPKCRNNMPAIGGHPAPPGPMRTNSRRLLFAAEHCAESPMCQRTHTPSSSRRSSTSPHPPTSCATPCNSLRWNAVIQTAGKAFLMRQLALVSPLTPPALRKQTCLLDPRNETTDSSRPTTYTRLPNADITAMCHRICMVRLPGSHSALGLLGASGRGGDRSTELAGTRNGGMPNSPPTLSPSAHDKPQLHAAP